MVLCASENNPGAKQAAEELVAQLASPHLSLTTKLVKPKRRDAWRLVMEHAAAKAEAEKAGAGATPSWKRAGKLAVKWRAEGEAEDRQPLKPATHFLIYLNAETFLHAKGDAFAEEARGSPHAPTGAHQRPI